MSWVMENTMTNEPSRQAGSAPVSKDEPYELAFFAKKHGLTLPASTDILAKFGPSRRSCDAAARRLKTGK